RRDAVRRGSLPAVASQADVFTRVPQPARLPARALARGAARQPCPWVVACAVLSRMLLGAHACPRGGGGHGAGVGATGYRSGRGREAATGWRMDGTSHWGSVPGARRGGGLAAGSRDHASEWSRNVIGFCIEGGISWQIPLGGSAETTSRRAAATPYARVPLQVSPRGRPRGTATPVSSSTSNAAHTARTRSTG